MGISGFWSFYGSLVKEVPIDKINKKIAVVDIILYLHKYIIGNRKNGVDAKSKSGKSINHIKAISKIIKNFTDNQILPICVFDGKSPLLKAHAVEKRKEYICASKQKCDKLKNIISDVSDVSDISDVSSDVSDVSDVSDEYIKYFKRSFSMTSEIISDCKKFLDLCGIPYVNSIGEADPQCAGLGYYYKNICSGVFSEDSDIILYGAPCILKDYNIYAKTVSIIYMEDILIFLQDKTNSITQKYNKPSIIFEKENFIDFSIIMGNDFCNGIRISGGNNRERLFELFVISNLNIVEFIKLLEIMNSNSDNIIYYITENFLIKADICKSMYLNVEIINPHMIDIKMKKSKESELFHYMESLDFKTDIVDNLNKSLENLYNYFKYSINIVSPCQQKSCKLDNSEEWITINNRKKTKLVY